MKIYAPFSTAALLLPVLSAAASCNSPPYELFLALSNIAAAETFCSAHVKVSTPQCTATETQISEDILRAQVSYFLRIFQVQFRHPLSQALQLTLPQSQ